MGTKFGHLTAEEALNLGYLPAQIFVDGVRLNDVSVVNDVEGWADVFQYDLFTSGMDEVPTKRIYGDVLYIPASGDLKL